MHVKRGECLIINQIQYAINIGFKKRLIDYRRGTLQDEKDLIEQWTNLGCRVHVQRNLTKPEMITALKFFKDSILEQEKPEFMVLVILSHGRLNSKTKLDEVLDINYKGLSTDYIVELFVDKIKCPAMANKPKLFFIQACRGRAFQKQLSGNFDDNVDDVELLFESEPRYDGRNRFSPAMHKEMSWYHIVYSTIKGFRSFRDEENGSLFIQILCDVLKTDCPRDDINTISSSVICRLMNTYKNIQAPVSINQLGDKVFVGPQKMNSRASNLLKHILELLKCAILWLSYHYILAIVISILIGLLIMEHFERGLPAVLLNCTFKCSLYRIFRLFLGENPVGLTPDCVVLYQDNCCNCNNFFWE